MKHQCSALVRNKTSFHRSHRCSFNGVVEREGKFYCRRHDPVVKDKAREKADRIFRLEQDVRTSKHAVISAAIKHFHSDGSRAALKSEVDHLVFTLDQLKRAKQ